MAFFRKSIGVGGSTQGTMVALPVVAEDRSVDGIEEKVVVAAVNPCVTQELVLQGFK